MHEIGRYIGAQRGLDGNLQVIFTLPNNALEQLEALKDKDIIVEAKQYRKHRSLSANAYFWSLCGAIAETLGTDKDTIYMMKLKEYGVMQVIDVITDGIPLIRQCFRYIEEDHRFQSTIVDEDGVVQTVTKAELHCYVGSSHYDSKQMSTLIDGTVSDAKALGISTWTQEEINNLIQDWTPRDKE